MDWGMTGFQTTLCIAIAGIIIAVLGLCERVGSVTDAINNQTTIIHELVEVDRR